MGTRNKQRRRAKKAKRSRSTQGASGRAAGGGHRRAPWGVPGGPPPHEVDEWKVDCTILDLVHMTCEGRTDDEGGLAWLTSAGLGSQRARTTTRLLGEHLESVVHLSLEEGWEPFELERMVRRRAKTVAAELARAALSGVVARWPEADDRDRWADQLADLGAGRRLDPVATTWAADVGAAVGAIEMLLHLPPPPELPREPGRPVTAAASSSPGAPEHDSAGRTAGLSVSMLARVRGLLAKSEATEYPEEADAFMAKAQELMTRHCLTRALVESAARTGDEGPEIDLRRCWLDDPYLSAKAILLHVVAQANRCRAVLAEPYGYATLVGHPDDLDVTEMLFTSLLVQGNRRMMTPVFEGVVPGRTSRPGYRRSFLVAYANRIGQRLFEASAQATEAASTELGESLLPVLADRRDEVDDAVDQLFDQLVQSRVAASDPLGRFAGMAAADLADLGVRERLHDPMAS